MKISTNLTRCLRFFFSITVTFFLLINTTQAQVVPCDGCTANDVDIVSVELVSQTPNPDNFPYDPADPDPQFLHGPLQTTCYGNDQVTGVLKITVDQNAANRYGFRVFGDIHINGLYSSMFSYCDPGTFTNNTYSVIYVETSPISWLCGSTLEIKNLFVGWSIDKDVTACATVNDGCELEPHCKQFELSDPPITVLTPLSGSFVIEAGSCPIGQAGYQSIFLDGSAAGGVEPYTYKWESSVDGTTWVQFSTDEDPTFEPGDGQSYHIKLIVNDAGSPANSVVTTQTGIVAASCCVLSESAATATKTNNNFCPGGSTTLGITGGTLGTGANWVWYADGCASGTSLGSGATLNVTPTITTTYYVRAEGECGNTICRSVTVTVNTESVEAATATATNNNFCPGGSTTLGITGGTLGTGANWVWYAEGCASGTSLGSGATLNVSPTITTTYYVRAEGECGNTICRSVTVTVNTESVEAATATTTNNNFCPGGSTTLGITGGTLGTGANWVWYAEGCASGTSLGSGATLNVSPTITTTYYVRAEGECGNTICRSVTVTINTESVAATTATTTNNNFCPGGSTTLDITGGTLGTGASWVWYAEGCASGTSLGSGATLNVSPTITTVYYVRAEGECGNTICRSVTVTVNTESVEAATATTTNNNFCPGGSTTLGITGGTLGTGANWVWYAEGCASGTSLGSGATLNVTPTITTTYYVRAEGECGNTICRSVTVTINTESVAAATATTTNNNFCPDGSTTLGITGGTLGTGASWVWYAEGCARGTSLGSGATLNVSPTITTTYYVRAEGECGNTICRSVVVTVNTESVAAATATTTNNNFCPGGSTTLGITGGTLGTRANWVWYADGCASGTSLGSGATLNVSPTITTTYYVRAEGECGNTICRSVVVTVKTESVTPTNISSSAVCYGQSRLLSIVGGSLGTGASWKWYADGCASGASIGTGSSITVTPSAATTYYVRAEGDCNNTDCVSTTVNVNSTFCTTYSGDLFKNTNSPTGGTATVLLKVVVTKSSEQGILNPGVFTLKVGTSTYVNEVGVVYIPDQSNPTHIEYSMNYPVSLPINGLLSTLLDVSWTFGNSCAANEACFENGTIVTVSAPADDFITGGGFIIPIRSGGNSGGASVDGLKNNFGFNLKFNKAGKLQGNWNTIIRKRVGAQIHSLQVKSNSAISLVVTKYPATPTTAKYARADMSFKAANFKNLTCDVCPTGANNGTVLVSVYDYGEPGSGVDKILITIKDAGGAIWYTSDNLRNHSITSTDLQLLNQGNIQIHKSGGTGGNNARGESLPITSNEVTDDFNAAVVMPNLPELIAYPNPSASDFRINVPMTSAHAIYDLKITDQAGRVIEIRRNIRAGEAIKLGKNYKTGIYIANLRQGNSVQQFKLIKL